jgi:hypothetical protein
MHHRPSARPLKAAASGLLAVLSAAGLSLALPAATPAASAATTGGTVTYSATVTVPAPPSSAFTGASGGGDGWGVALTPTQVFNVFHHQSYLGVNCHNQADASDCWTSYKTVTDASGNAFATSGQPGLWMDQANGHLFVFATRSSDNTAGVVCIDTTLPAAATDLFCGYTPLTAPGDSALVGGISGASDPVQVGNKLYAFNYQATTGVPTGTQDELMCFNEATLAACASQPYAVNLGSGVSISDGGFPSPSVAVVNNLIFVPAQTSAGSVMGCYNPGGAGGSCGGSWPVSVPTNYPSGDGAAFPLLNASGTATGLCLPSTGDPCFDFTGASATTPSGLAAVVAPSGNTGWNGEATTLGPRVYVPDGNLNGEVGGVECFDFSANTGCAGFGTNGVLAFQGLDYLYTVNPDPQRPTCFWVNADNGADQIQNFDAYTGGACGAGPIRVLASSVVAPHNQCVPTSWSSLQVQSPVRNTYSSGSVDFEDQDGNPIPGFNTHTLDASGTTSLTDLHLTTQNALPQFLITLNNEVNKVTEVVVKLTWSGQYSQDCVQPGTTVSGGYRMAGADGGAFAFGNLPFAGSSAGPGTHLNAPVVGIADALGTGYWLGAGDGGVFTFGTLTFYGSMAGHPLNAPIVGIAATPDGHGYWLVGGDGGTFAFGDAPYKGSLAGHALNAPIVGMAPTADGQGYWLVGRDGGVFAFGDAAYLGSLVGMSGIPNSPVVGIAALPNGTGYWIAQADGAVTPLGAAPSVGDHRATPLHAPIVGIAPTPDGQGFWLAGMDGGAFAYGDAPFLGSLALSKLNAPMVGISA